MTKTPLPKSRSWRSWNSAVAALSCGHQGNLMDIMVGDHVILARRRAAANHRSARHTFHGCNGRRAFLLPQRLSKALVSNSSAGRIGRRKCGHDARRRAYQRQRARDLLRPRFLRTSRFARGRPNCIQWRPAGSIFSAIFTTVTGRGGRRCSRFENAVSADMKRRLPGDV